MSLWELFITAVALSMDAFAVSMCKGLSVQKAQKHHFFLVGIYFGGFQALMPLIGFLLGFRFRHLVEKCDHWIAFVLLAIIGFNMIREAFGDSEEFDCSFSFKAMLPLAVATSIDALAVGVGFSFLPDVDIVSAVIFIGMTTFTLSAFGVYIGNKFGAKFKSKAEVAGGVILILLGFKILLEHLGFLSLPF